MDEIKITYEGKDYSFKKGVTLKEIAENAKSDFKEDIVAGTINNRLSNLSTNITRDSKVKLFSVDSLLGNRTYERGLYFLFSKAVMDILKCDVKIMYLLDGGTYCEVLSNNLISDVIVEKIKLRMQELVKEEIDIERIMVSRLDAIDYYTKINQLDKARSLRYISNSSISLYKLDDTLNYFYGVLPDNTRVFKNFDLKYLGENKLMLLFPYYYNGISNKKYEKNDLMIKSIRRNDSYLESLNIGTSADLNEKVATGKYADIIRLSESVQNNRIFEIVNEISQDKNIKMILITGPSSSGKTTISKKLTLFLRSKGYKPIQISVDDFYKKPEDRELDENGMVERERIGAFDTNLFNNKMDELIQGKEVSLPKYDFNEDKRFMSSKKVKMEENSILVIEGIHAFNDKLTEIIPDKHKFKIFICPLTPLNIDNHNLFRSTDNRLLRRIVRDNISRSTSASETLKSWKQVRKIEEEIILPYSNEADEVINTSLAYELSVLKTYAEPLLYSVNETDENYDDALRLINLFRVILGIPGDAISDDSILREFIGGSCFDS